MNTYRNLHRATKKAVGNCRLKDHFLGGHREVIGYLDLLASNDPERFAFPHVPTIVALCKKYQTKELHSKSWVEKILRDLRKWHIISRRVTRVRNYKLLRGVIVAPHDVLAERKPATSGQGSVCVFMGQRWGVGKWEKEITETKTPDGRTVVKIDPAYWIAGAVSSAASGAVGSAVSSAADSAALSAVESAVPLSGQKYDSTKVKPENPARAFRVVLTEGDEQAVQAPASQPEPAPPKNRAGGQAGASNSSSSTSSNTTCKAPSEVEIRWQKFLQEAGRLPEVMRYAVPTPAERDAVLAQLDQIPESELKRVSRVDYFSYEIETFVDHRSPPIVDRHFGRWSCWLKEGKWPCW